MPELAELPDVPVQLLCSEAEPLLDDDSDNRLFPDLDDLLPPDFVL
jgi:hypothetical protein